VNRSRNYWIPSNFTIANAISFSGTLIPTVVFFKFFGKLLFPGKIKVYGPGKALLTI
jgi:hypothetical protein